MSNKFLEKILFTRQTESFFLSEFFLIRFGAKKVFVLSLCGCWSNWWKKCCVHCGTSCKIRTQTDKNCGNESKIRLTHKIRCFTPPFLPPGFLTKKHAKMGTLLISFFSIFLNIINARPMTDRKKPFPMSVVPIWGPGKG